MLRPEGKRSMTPREFRAGNPIEDGEVLVNTPSD
jgi:hypothetical protein